MNTEKRLNLLRRPGVLRSGALALAVAGALAITSGGAFASTPDSSGTPTTNVPTVTVTGTADLTMVATTTTQSNPGAQNINFSIESAPTSSPTTAIKSVQSGLANVKAAIAKAGGTIMNENMSINPNQPGPKPMVKAGASSPSSTPNQFIARANVQVQLPASASINNVIDTALAAGATGFNYYSGSGKGTHWKPTDVSKAIAAAYADAHTQASAMASAMGDTLGSVDKATVDQNGPYYGPQSFERVTVTYYLQPKQ